MKQKWKNRTLPRGVHINHNGYVMVRKFFKGKALPQKSFGLASPESVDRAILYATGLNQSLKTGRTSVEDQKEIRWPFPYAMKEFLKVAPQWRYFDATLNSFFGRYYFDDLWFKVVEGYRPFRIGQAVKNSNIGRHVSDSTVNKELACLSSMFYTFRRLKQLGKIPNVKLPVENPTRGVPRIDETHMRRKRIITPVEFGQIMTEASPRMRRRILAALNTGLRRKDIFSLSKGSLDPYMNQLEGLMHKVGSSFKTASNAVMEELYATAEGDVVVNEVNHEPEFNALRKKCREKYGMPDFIFKDFRRTAAWTVWIKEKNIFKVMALLNHKKITTTQRYLGITGEDLEATGRTLAETFNFPLETATNTETNEGSKSQIQTATKTATKSPFKKVEKQSKNTDKQAFRAVSSVG